MTGSSGALAERMNLRPGLLAARPVGLADRRPEGQALGDDRRAEDDQRHPPPAPVEQRVRVTQVDLVPLVVRLVQREQPADAEQHHGHDEAEDVALAAVAERVLGRHALLRPPAADQQQHLVARVGDGVDRLGEHRGRPGQRERAELHQRDGQVGAQRRHHRLVPTLCAHGGDPLRRRGSGRPPARGRSRSKHSLTTSPMRPLPRLVEPGLERHVQHDDRQLGEQGGLDLVDPAGHQPRPDHRDEVVPLLRVALAQRRLGDDQVAAPPDLLPAAVEAVAGHLAQALLEQGDGVEPGRGRRQQAPGERGDLVAGEEHLALVGEVAEERPGRQAGPRGDLGHRRRGEALLGEQLERRALQPAARVRVHRATPPPSTPGKR